MAYFDLSGLIGQEIIENTAVTEGLLGRACKKIHWTVIEAYPCFVKAMRITENGTEAYTTFNIGTLITMGVIRQKGVKYYG